jgi:predicted enzyme related to lactoylglutathione lyase
VTVFSSHVPGTFSWVELATTDQAAAVAFYRTLFGWGVNEYPMGPDEVYSMLQLRGLDVAAAYTMRGTERESGVPPHWNLYVTVASVDEAVRQAQALGATVVAPAFDVMDAGRMAVLQDPAGAAFQVWEPRQHIGSQILNEPGALCWTELTTRDPTAAAAFYTALFGWAAQHGAPGAVQDYTHFTVGGVPSIGMLEMPSDMPAGIPSFWMPYFQVTEVDASVGTAAEHGARVMRPPQDLPGTGRFAILADPQGAAFAVFSQA